MTSVLQLHQQPAPVVDARRILERGRDTNALEIVCPYCDELHYHGGCGAPGEGDGHRSAHCIAPGSERGYILREIGTREGRSPVRRRRGPSPYGSPARRRDPISPATRARIMERDGFRCRRCGAGPRDERLVVDHVVPVALGGSSDDENLQTLCDPCNIGKGARPPHPHDLAPFGEA